MRKKEVTIEKLAEMIAKGFETTATKEEIGHLVTKEEFRHLAEDVRILRRDTESGFSEIIGALKSIQNEITDLKKLDLEVVELRRRVEQLEKKLGV